MKTFIPAIASALFLTVGLTNVASAGLSLQERALTPAAADAQASVPTANKGGFQFDSGTRLVEGRLTSAPADKGSYQTASYDPNPETKTVLPPPGPKQEIENKPSAPAATAKTTVKPRYQKAERRERVRYTSEPVYHQSRPTPFRPMVGAMRVMRF